MANKPATQAADILAVSSITRWVDELRYRCPALEKVLASLQELIAEHRKGRLTSAQVKEGARNLQDAFKSQIEAQKIEYIRKSANSLIERVMDVFGAM